MALKRRLLVEFDRVALVLFHALTILKHDAQPVLRFGVPVLGCLLEEFSRTGLVLLNTLEATVQIYGHEVDLLCHLH